jgi:hypothetical protein
MDIYQRIAELTAELHDARLTKAERQTAICQLHDLQHELELDEVNAIDSGDAAAAAVLFDQWSRIEGALAA